MDIYGYFGFHSLGKPFADGILMASDGFNKKLLWKWHCDQRSENLFNNK